MPNTEKRKKYLEIEISEVENGFTVYAKDASTQLYRVYVAQDYGEMAGTVKALISDHFN